MKTWLSVVLLLLTLNACVKRTLAPSVAQIVLPRTCVTDLRFTQSAVCRPMQDGTFSCDGVIVHAACTKVLAPPSVSRASTTERAQK